MPKTFLAYLLVLGSLQALALTPPKPYVLDSHGKPVYKSPRSICGANDMLPMFQQSEDMKEMGTPIGIYEALIDGGTGYCTGTLITKDLFLTAEHCAAECDDIKVTFGYLKDGRQEDFKCKQIIEKGDGKYENDYFIIRLEGNPGVKWGWYNVSAEPLPASSKLLMIHHPQGTPMKVSQENCSLVAEESGFLRHHCDTQPGSSGSAILLPNYQNPEQTRIVGVHTLGGCDDEETASNSGPSMRHLVEVSPTLKSLAK
jgi:hypothetical protein